MSLPCPLPGCPSDDGHAHPPRDNVRSRRPWLTFVTPTCSSSAINISASPDAGGSSSDNSSASNLPKDRFDPGKFTPPSLDTPEIKPSLAPDNVLPAASPMLDAISNASVSAPSMTNEWARAGGLAGSPGNLISLMGDSPPTQPSSYEDASGRLHQGWPAHRPFMSPSPASPSPPNSVRRPLSFQMEPQYQSPDALPQSSPSGFRRSSLHSQISHARNGSNPPLPHQPQAHFYGAPDLDLTITPQSGMKAGDRGYFFGFDRLPSLSNPAPTCDNVVVAGYEGGLDVYAVSKKGLEPVATLKGLRGGVHHAKILPWTVTGEQQANFPLIAVVLHGPVMPQNASGAAMQSVSPSPRLDGAASPRSVFGQPDIYSGRGALLVDSYETSVHVYSLKTNKLIDVLLQSPKVPVNTAVSLTSPIFQPPPPSGAFTIKADAGTVAVCSGTTGECWIYLQLLEAQNTHWFTCVGKLWTSLQHGHRSDMEEGDKTLGSSKLPRANPATPIVALNGRWIAYCPSPPSSQLTLKAHVPVPILGRAPGLSSVTPPPLPLATASVDLISNSFVNKIMRETTQELIQGAKWVGQQSLQAWNAYWNKSQNPQPQPQQARSPPAQFPPTHGTTAQPAPKEPGLVSIIDAEALAESSVIHPITSFAPPQGCSFLSFSPTSLALFTASSKGDVQNVWDLLRIQYTKSSPLQATVSPTEGSGPQVRQVAQFSRMTVARIVDVAWAEPHGERLAVTTERGTVHLLEMPFSAFMWPAPRRRKAAHETSAETEASNSAVSIATGAFGAAYHAARPFVTKPRRSSANIPVATGAMFKDQAAQGGRKIAASISSSLGKTGTALNQLRHSGDNRISLPPSTILPVASCVNWIRGRRSHSLFTLGDGLVRVYPNKTRRSNAQPGKRNIRSGLPRDLRVPTLPDDTVAPAVRQILDVGAPEEDLDLTDRDMEAGNTLTFNKPMPRSVAIEEGMDTAIPQAEIESSAPYQPFHTDRRVSLCEYRRDTIPPPEAVSDLLASASLDAQPSATRKKNKQSTGASSNVGKVGYGESAWAFGQDIPVVKLDLGLPPILDDDFPGADEDQPLPPSAMERVMQYGDAEQIVVTTRRRRSARHGDVDGDGFFEDDCEVLDFADQRV